MKTLSIALGIGCFLSNFLSAAESCGRETIIVPAKSYVSRMASFGFDSGMPTATIDPTQACIGEQNSEPAECVLVHGLYVLKTGSIRYNGETYSVDRYLQKVTRDVNEEFLKQNPKACLKKANGARNALLIHRSLGNGQIDASFVDIDRPDNCFIFRADKKGLGDIRKNVTRDNSPVRDAIQGLRKHNDSASAEESKSTELKEAKPTKRFSCIVQ